MYVILLPIQVNEGSRDAFIEATIEDARSSVASEPGCLRFDVIADAADENRFWLYEVYVDEAAFEAHLETPHLRKWREIVDPIRVAGPQGAKLGSGMVWPPESEWT